MSTLPRNALLYSLLYWPPKRGEGGTGEASDTAPYLGFRWWAL